MTPRYLSLVVPLKKVGDEVVHKELGDRMERAATTVSSLEAEQDSGSGPRCQDTILGDVDAQTRFETTSKQSNDSPLSKVNTFRSGEDSMQLMELMTHCTKLFALDSAKLRTVNGDIQIQALIDEKKIIVNEVSIRRDLKLDDVEGSPCLPNATIFEELTRTGAKTTAWNEFSSTMTSAIICLANNQKFNFSNFEESGEDLDLPTDSTQIPIVDQPSTSSQPKKKQKYRRKQRKEAEVAHDEPEHEESVPTTSKDPLPSAIEIASLKKRVGKLEKRRKFRTTRLKRLKKVGTAKRIESSNDSLGALEDASKQGRRIEDIDADAEVTLERQDEDLMFDTGVLDGDEMFVDATTGEKDEQSTKIDDSTASEAVTTAGVEDSVAPIIPTTVEETLAQTLMEIKAAKPKAKGIVFHDLEKHVSKPTVSVTQPSIKDKGKGIMQELERPLTKKDQVAHDEDFARNLQAQLEAEIIEEERLERQKEEEANIALIESWKNTQAMMKADRLLAKRLQTREREELTDAEQGKLFMEHMEKRRKHFAAQRAQEKRNRPPTKAKKRSQMSTYLKHIGGYKHKQRKGKSYEEIQKLFDKEMKRINTFVDMSSKAQESNEKKVEGSEEKSNGSRKKILGKKRAKKRATTRISKGDQKNVWMIQKTYVHGR
ncbi:hypothetical protein Tco_0059689 [Tanacetum coccineum]